MKTIITAVSAMLSTADKASSAAAAGFLIGRGDIANANPADSGELHLEGNIARAALRLEPNGRTTAAPVPPGLPMRLAGTGMAGA